MEQILKKIGDKWYSFKMSISDWMDERPRTIKLFTILFFIAIFTIGLILLAKSDYKFEEIDLCSGYKYSSMKDIPAGCIKQYLK